MNRLMQMALVFLVCAGAPAAPTFAQYYVTKGTILYERYSVPYTYYYCGRAYTGYKYQYKQVLDYSKPDWRNKALDLIDRQKERESFQQTLTYLGAQGLMAPVGTAYAPYPIVQQQGAALYPSATGTTQGGFAQVEYSRYGATSPMDVNRANEIIGGTIDAFNRTSADNARRGIEINGAVATLIDKNGERIAAIGELQETRQAVKEMSIGMNQMFQGFAQAMQSMKAQPSEHFTFQQGSAQGHIGAQGSGQQPYPQQAPQGHYPAPQAPQQPYPEPVPQENPPPRPNEPAPIDVGVISKYCGACHGKEAGTPQGNFYLDPSAPISEAQFGALAMRMDPNAPAYRDAQKTKAYRMPPENVQPQPTLEERRAIVDFAKRLVGGG